MRERKLIIQIPCWNEADALPATIAALPAAVPGYDSVETLVIDDGSTDGTATVARALGVTHVMEFPHRGLAQTFASGLRQAVALGAHTIVNFDADNQYEAADIATITAPIVAGTASVVIGERQVGSIGHFSPTKRRLHAAGNAAMRWLCKSPVTDAASGFRAIRWDVAEQLAIRSTYTYTLEMLLLLQQARVTMTYVPIRVTDRAPRPSRLIRSNAHYLFNNARTLAVTLVRCRRLQRHASAETPMALELALHHAEPLA